MKRRLAMCAALLTVLMTLTGCWDLHDISDRTPILGVGFDYLPSGKWRITAAEATLPQGGTPTYTGVLHTGDGGTPTDAIEDLRTHLARGLYLGSAKVFVLGSGVMQGHAEEVLRMLLQRQEVDQTGFVIGTRGTAEALFAKPDGVMGVTAVRLLKEFEVHPGTRDGEVAEPLWKTVWGVLAVGDTLRVPVFDVLPATSVAQTGVGLISGSRLRLVLDREEGATLRWLANLPGRHTLALEPPLQAYVLKMTTVHTAASYDGQARHLSLRITAGAEAYTTPAMTLDAKLVQTLAQAAAETLTRRAVGVIQKMQAAGADGAMWREVAMQAGYFDFDIRQTSVTVQVQVHMTPKFAPTP